jgi:hypothetical protein
VQINKEEFASGAFISGVIVGLAHCPVYIIVGAGVLCGFMWAIGGSGYKWLRRFGVPTVLGTLLVAYGNACGWITGILLIPILSIGYGVPSVQPPDEGSVLGRWAWKLVNGDHEDQEACQRFACFICRTLLGMLISIACLPLALGWNNALLVLLISLGYPLICYYVE